MEYLIVGVERLTFRVQVHEVGSQATMLWARDHSRTLARVVKNGVWLERRWSVVGERLEWLERGGLLRCQERKGLHGFGGPG